MKAFNDNIMAQAIHLKNVVHGRNVYTALSILFQALSNINYAHIKGDCISLMAYGKLGQRQFSDIDLLVSREDLYKVEAVLEQNGFLQPQIDKKDARKYRIFTMTSSHQTIPYSSRGMLKIPIDLNFDIFWGEYTGKRVNICKFLSDTIEMNIYGVKVKTLPPLKAMVQLILHHYKEMNSLYHLSQHNCIHFNMFKDIYYLWKNNQQEISLDKLYAISLEYDIIPYVFYVLYFTNQIFNDLEFSQYVETFRTSAGVKLLDYYGLSEKERKRWKVDFTTRLETENMYDLIKEDLTDADIEKLDRNRRIFG